jgi:5'-deoxynucleotidase YfbR-like HD superfamily hydrolase
VNLSQLMKVREASRVKRYAVDPIIGEDTVGHHSQGVAVLMIIFLEDLSKELLKAAITHDMAERWCGDLPAPFKWANKDFCGKHAEYEAAKLIELKFAWQLSTLDTMYLRIFDVLDACLFGYQQYLLGNKHGAKIFRACFEWFSNNEMELPIPFEVSELLNEIFQIIDHKDWSGWDEQ